MVCLGLIATKIGHYFPIQLLLGSFMAVKVTKLGEYLPKMVAFVYPMESCPKMVAYTPKKVALAPKMVAYTPKKVAFRPKLVAFKLIIS